MECRKFKLEKEVKQLIKTSKDAQEILDLAKGALNDGRNYILKVQKGNSYLYGDVNRPSNNGYINVAYDEQDRGFSEVVNSIKTIYQNALKVMDAEDDRLKAQDMLKDI